MPAIAEIMTTYGTKEDAEKAASALLANRLAACVHVTGPISSFFCWDGDVQCEEEWQLIAKTSQTLAPTAIADLRKTHPYDLPAVLCQYVEALVDFADWVQSETTD